MVLTVNDFSGGETGGLEEVSAFNGSPNTSDSGPRPGGTRFYRVPGHDAWIEFTPFSTGKVADAGDDYIVGAALKAASSWDGPALSIMEGSNVVLQLEFSSGSTIVTDAEGSTIRTLSDAINDGEWHFVEIYFQNQASGIVEVFVDGVSQGSDSAQDLTDGGSFDTVRFIGEVEPQAGLLRVDDYYCLSGASSSADVLGDAEVFKYQSTKASASPDDSTRTDVLDSGNWGDAGDTPLNTSSVASFTSGPASGAVFTDAANGSPEGPKNDARIDGDSNIKGMKGVWHMKRGTGPGTTHRGILGNSVDDGILVGNFAATTDFANYFHVLNPAQSASIPLSTEYADIGFNITANQDFDCGDMWAMLLHVPDSEAEAVSGNGDLTAQSATISGSGVGPALGNGDPQAQAATIVGSGTANVAGDGSLSAQAATIDASGVSKSDGNGELSAQESTLAGSGKVAHTGNGELQANAATVVGSGAADAVGNGSLSVGAAALTGEGTADAVGNGTLSAQAATIVGSGAADAIGNGALAAQAAAIAGSGAVASDAETGNGALAANDNTIVGSGVSLSSGNGALAAGSAAIIGNDATQSAIAVIMYHHRHHNRAA